MTQYRRINELAALITKNTAIVDQHLESKNLSTPSLGLEAPRKIPIAPNAPEIERARVAVIEATAELKAIMMGPSELLRPGYTDYVGLKAVTHFQIDKAFPIGEEVTYDDLARATGLKERNLRRLLRHAITDHVFCEPRKGVVAHNALSKLLAEDDLLHDCVSNALDELWPAASRVVEATEKWPGSEEPNETGFSLANNTNKSMYDVFEQNAARAEKFARAMSANTDAEGYSTDLLLNGYPWGTLGSALVVDVGGSQGSVAIGIANQFPDIQCIVQDLPHVITKGISALPKELSGRVKFMAHDFFTDQPVSADVYYFRSIFHNWSDKYSIQILRHLVPALKPGARLLIHEFVVPEPNTLSPREERRVRHMDIAMLQLFNAYQRDEEEWVALLGQADARFKLRGHSRPVGAAQSIIDVVWESDGRP